MTSLHKFSVEF